MISYWARMLTGKETKLSYLSYKILYNLFIDVSGIVERHRLKLSFRYSWNWNLNFGVQRHFQHYFSYIMFRG
jgi:hypothetical protein